jgi:Uma2 family endonuclease
MSNEQIFSHNLVKVEFYVVVGAIVKAEGLGRLHADCVMLVHPGADLATQPDGLFASFETLRTRRLRLVKGKRRGFVELRGTPDMVLEVVSESSVHKDTEELMELYWRAGIKEYWLVDARFEKAQFDIYTRGSRGYLLVRAAGGWLKSAVLGHSFRLAAHKDALGDPAYTLSVR